MTIIPLIFLNQGFKMKKIYSKILTIIVLLTISSTSLLAEPEKHKNIVIDIDFMRGLTFQRPASQIILGNPIIADITVKDDKNIFLSGKSPGRTNMLIYGRDGELSEQFTLVVRDPNAYLTVFQGSKDRSHFDCEPLCQRVLRIEDRGQSAEEQRGRIAAQIEMIDGRARQSRSEELVEQQQAQQ